MNKNKKLTEVIKTTLEKELDRFYKRLLARKSIRICVYACLVVFFPGLILAISIADEYGPYGYSIINNFISDLGSPNYTPTPYILDIIAILTGIFMIPIFLYMKEILVKGPNRGKKISNDSILIKTLAKLGKIFLILGAIGLIGIGSFDENFFIHEIFAIFAFVGFIAGAIFYGVIIIIKRTIFPEILGYYMAFNSPTLLILYFIRIPPFTLPFIEWCILFNIIIWTFPSAIILLRHLNVKIAGCE